MCLYPVTIKTEDAFGITVSQSVPCGKCIECLKDKQNSWKIRLTEESRDHLYVYFFTLTYNDDSAPYVYDEEGSKVLQLNKNHVQLWIKRLRMRYERKFGRKIDFKYFVCGEYGPNTGRPHYHGIFFTNDILPIYARQMFSDWEQMYGYTKWSEVGKKKRKKRGSVSAVGSYVAKYCAKPKQLLTEAELRIDGLIQAGIIQPTFYIMSKGIGNGYIQRMKRWHVPNIKNPRDRVSVVCDRSFYHEGKFKYKLPRFFRDRLYRMKFPCDARVWNQKKKCYENKIVYRYKSKNVLSLQIANEVRSRLLAEYNERISELVARYPHKSRAEMDIELVLAESAARMDRQKNIYSKLARFYNSHRHKNRKL